MHWANIVIDFDLYFYSFMIASYSVHTFSTLDKSKLDLVCLSVLVLPLWSLSFNRTHVYFTSFSCLEKCYM